MTPLAQALRRVRAKAGLSQQRMATLLGCYNKRYMAIERGHKVPFAGEPEAWDEKLRTSDWGISLAAAAKEEGALEEAGKGQESCQVSRQ